jgi:hypothetical protein
VRRVRYRPKVSVLGLVSALVGSLGGLLFMQQRGSVFPTSTVGIITIVVALVSGIALPSLGRVVATRRINRRLARLSSDGP